MNLYSVIYQLIIDNDCVIIPNFGGFVANKFSANVDFSKQEFYPPSRKLAFNENLSLSDGLLLNYITNTEQVSWSEAENYVRNFVNEINLKLIDGQVVVFDGIGEFSRNQGNLVFSPFDVNFSEDAFGLYSFNFPLLHSTSSVTERIKIISDDTNKATKSKKVKILVSALSTAAVISGFLFFSIQFGFFDTLFKQQTNTEVSTAALIDTNSQKPADKITDATLDSEMPIDLESQVVVKEESIVDEMPLAEPVAESVSSETIYNTHIIAGCFSNYENAESMLASLKALGLDSQILPQHKGLYKVSVKSFENSQIATTELSHLKEVTGNQGLWILNL